MWCLIWVYAVWSGLFGHYLQEDMILVRQGQLHCFMSFWLSVPVIKQHTAHKTVVFTAVQCFSSDKQLEPGHKKTYSKNSFTNKDSDQFVRPRSMARTFVYSFLNSLEDVEGTCDQWRLRSDCADRKADLSLYWLHNSYSRFCCVLAHFWLEENNLMYLSRVQFSEQFF